MSGRFLYLQNSFGGPPPSLLRVADHQIDIYQQHDTERLVATTLDPFFHHGAFSMPATTRMIAGMMPWLIETEAERKAALAE